mmetsp:Transcript_6584/g.24648  ORF Transcript_6584/g.24648 Transcript_6584/m.24648 type:complete len:147 (-) Transcript_6584:995-1435(-)
MFGSQQYTNNFFNSRKITADSIDSGSIRTDSLTSTSSTTTTISGPLTTDTINEETSGAGVTIDSVLLKDGLVDGVDVSALKTDVDGFPDGLKSFTSAQITELQNIGVETTISGTQWGYLGNIDQNVGTTNDVTFNNITGTVAEWME